MKNINLKTMLSAGIVSIILSGCITDDLGTKTLAGGMIGAGVGGLLGSKIGGGKGQLAAVAVGTLAGALFGSSIGKSLGREDRLYVALSERRAETAPIGKTIIWNNPKSGYGGSVTPTRDGIDKQTGKYCREYHTEIYVGGRLEDAYGTSCRQPDGTWQIISH